jgi:calcium-dependent protein kinase
MNGEIEFTEFIAATANRDKILSDQKLLSAFQIYDKDNNGTIDMNELKEVLGVGAKISDLVWREMIDEIDENGDGLISFEEFKKMMNRLKK